MNTEAKHYIEIPNGILFNITTTDETNFKIDNMFKYIHDNPNGTDIPEKYISNYTTILDIEILFMTIKTVLSKSMAEGVDNSNLSFNDFLIEEEVEFEDDKGYYHLRYNKKKA